jgi:hypothetical protein
MKKREVGEMQQLRIYLPRSGRADFLALLTESGVEFAERYPAPGQIVAAGNAVEIIGALGTAVFGPVTYVMGKWLNARSSRRAIVTLRDRQIRHFDARGYSSEEVSRLLSQAITITVVQSTSDDDTGSAD